MAAGLSLRDLPADVIIAILSHLPIAEAVRTSILSRSWRHQWRSIPDLAFNLDDDLDIAAVDHVLGLHSTPIQSFSLSGDYELNSNDLDRWLATLSADPLPLRSLTLDVCGPHFDPLPSIPYPLLLSFSNLNHLCLVGCSLPSYYHGLVGFPILETLHLSSCILPDDDISSISNLISYCPLLQKLTLLDVDCSHLRICAPNLRSFVFEGGLEGFALASAPLLNTVVIHLHDFYCDNEEEELNSCNLIKAFGNARSIKKLNLIGYSLNFLGNFEILDRIPDSFERLKVLTLTINFSNVNETLVLLCLLRSAPNLHEINIEGLKRGRKFRRLGHEFWQAQNHLELPKLQTLKLTHKSHVEPMLDFIDYILPKAQELKKMEINISPCSKKYGSIGKLSDFGVLVLVLQWRASTRAQIIFRGDFLSKCAITSSGSDAASLVWISNASREGFNELRDHIESKLQGIEDRVQKMESRLWDRVEELHCQIRGEFLPECVIASSESDVASSVWITSALWEEFSQLRDHVKSKLQGIEDRFQKMETKLQDREDRLQKMETVLDCLNAWYRRSISEDGD